MLQLIQIPRMEFKGLVFTDNGWGEGRTGSTTINNFFSVARKGGQSQEDPLLVHMKRVDEGAPDGQKE